MVEHDLHFKFSKPKIIGPTIWLLILIFIGFIALGSYAVVRLDDVKKDNSQLQIWNEMEHIKDGMWKGLIGWSVWDDAVNNLVLRFNRNWALNNFGGNLLIEQEIDHILIYNPAGKLVYSYPEKDADGWASTFSPNVSFIQNTYKDNTKPLAGFITSKSGKLALSAVSHIQNLSQNQGRPTDALIVFIRTLDSNEYKNMDSVFGIKNVRHLTIIEPSALKKNTLYRPITDFRGTGIGYLVWDIDLPSLNFLKDIAVPSLVLFIILSVFAYIILRNNHRTLDKMVENERMLLLFAKAIDASAVSMTIADATKPDMPLIFVNRAFTRRTDYTMAEAIGRNCRFLQGSDSDPKAVAALRANIAEKLDCTVEIVNYTKNGEQFWNRLTLSPIFDDNQMLAGYIGLQYDISKEMNDQQQRWQRDKMISMGQLAGGAAHEINNLLQPGLTFTQLALDMVGHDADDKTKKTRSFLTQSLESIKQAGVIVRSMLAFARQDEVTLTPQPIGPLCVESLSLLRILVPPTMIFEFSKAAKHQTLVNINATQVTQLLTNLVLNSAYAMQNRGLLDVSIDIVQISARDALLWAMPEGSTLLLSVKDTGPGMDESTRCKAFEPFFTTKPVGQGTGLGLSICHSIVKSWGGWIAIDSAPGRGTTVNVYLPIYRGNMDNA